MNGKNVQKTYICHAWLTENLKSHWYFFLAFSTGKMGAVGVHHQKVSLLIMENWDSTGCVSGRHIFQTFVGAAQWATIIQESKWIHAVEALGNDVPLWAWLRFSNQRNCDFLVFPSGHNKAPAAKSFLVGFLLLTT